ncbi:hypothetical protein EVAR_98201_1 [Eumeta japonica]|uniref:Tc1-like transposase DDE domain-containing protein n=1 Tax=Eumeta variegata TaxID=151549 RepID=A0A4C1Y351_EUMVA|nr:hypothetical protein EVAR_98201_1 [Eumeta japonica]
MAKKKVVEVLRLPPYHCELNPIELVWADIKGHVARNNTIFKIADVKKLLSEGLTQIMPENATQLAVTRHETVHQHTDFYTFVLLVYTGCVKLLTLLERKNRKGQSESECVALERMRVVYLLQASASVSNE